ncbi:hypothetical protein HWV62_26021 [Athelia sp. TMB]|nr:hypothetical protein HWV62_40270 [Athelia sp. TMB]KAF7969787.1 hypothetical protein HWV62_26021 [Athelia sp. TMB]
MPDRTFNAPQILALNNLAYSNWQLACMYKEMCAMPLENMDAVVSASQAINNHVEDTLDIWLDLPIGFYQMFRVQEENRKLEDRLPLYKKIVSENKPDEPGDAVKTSSNELTVEPAAQALFLRMRAAQKRGIYYEGEEPTDTFDLMSRDNLEPQGAASNRTPAPPSVEPANSKTAAKGSKVPPCEACKDKNVDCQAEEPDPQQRMTPCASCKRAKKRCSENTKVRRSHKEPESETESTRQTTRLIDLENSADAEVTEGRAIGLPTLIDSDFEAAGKEPQQPFETRFDEAGVHDLKQPAVGAGEDDGPPQRSETIMSNEIKRLIEVNSNWEVLHEKMREELVSLREKVLRLEGCCDKFGAFKMRIEASHRDQTYHQGHHGNINFGGPGDLYLGTVNPAQTIAGVWGAPPSTSTVVDDILDVDPTTYRMGGALDPNAVGNDLKIFSTGQWSIVSDDGWS